jgi:branched-chain amino acid transport system ATP-binding protein
VKTSKLPLLSLKDLSRSFGAITVADGISLDVPEGQALGILGPNGAGKTSLFNLITGTLSPDSGSITFQQRDITRVSAAKRCRAGIARSFQIPQPFAAMSVFENVLVGAIHGAALPREQAYQVSLEVLERTGLAKRANEPAGKLTLLERKRLELSRALAAAPKILLLDEIAGGLTDRECQSLIETIQGIRQSGVTIIWIEHIVHALLAVVERLVVIDFGQLIADGNPEQVMQSDLVKEIYMGLDTHA